MNKYNFKLFAVSFVMLFLEIFLIRWISTEIRVFAYVSNLVLLACFLGIGIGCYIAKKPANLLITILMLMVISLAVVSGPFKEITSMLSNFSDSVIWGQSLKPASMVPVINATLLTIFMFLMILTAFIPLGQVLGKLLDEHNNVIIGYSVNILGSLIGIWFFNICSFFSTNPWVWFTLALAILLFFVPRKKLDMSIAVSVSLLVLLLTGILSPNALILWSPYQKLSVSSNVYKGIHNGYTVEVNNTGYMGIMDLSESFIKQYPRRYNINQRKFNIYELPYQFVDNKDSALIVGAGGGNDVAGAIRSGVEEIDAVEIDPGIYRLGLALHPEHPYENEKVTVTIDDARAFLKKTKKKYDIITVGLLDSHTLSSNYNNMRLDHYVYTKESFQNMKEKLKKDGVLSVIFGVRRNWIGQRICLMLKEIFGDVPYVFSAGFTDARFGWHGTMFIAGKNPEKIRQAVSQNLDLKNYIEGRSLEFVGSVKSATDDWPYLYIQKPSIPTMYLLVIISIVVILLLAKRLFFNLNTSRVNKHFFFLGCAFLLLEFQNVSKSALLFGSTWIVNSYIISSILFLILAANLFVYYSKRRNPKIYYLPLLLSIVVSYLTPLDAFNVFGYWTKSILAVLILNLPIFFAGIIFIHSFKSTKSKDIALGSNLIGATTGGLLETLSFIVGIKALLILVFIFYTASLVTIGSASES